jgi:hypothetical protein
VLANLIAAKHALNASTEEADELRRHVQQSSLDKKQLLQWRADHSVHILELHNKNKKFELLSSGPLQQMEKLSQSAPVPKSTNEAEEVAQETEAYLRFKRHLDAVRSTLISKQKEKALAMVELDEEHRRVLLYPTTVLAQAEVGPTRPH